MTKLRKFPVALSPVALVASPLLIAGCGMNNEPAQQATATPATGSATNAAGDEAVVKPQKSIIRSDLIPTLVEEPSLEPVQITVAFPEKDTEPAQEGLSAVDELMAMPVFKAGGPVTIWGHSDSHGSDSVNMAASRRRAEAVRHYLEEHGVPRQRLTVIALGESRPVAPNRNLDGTDNSEGRAKNRRVEIRVEPPAPAEDQEVPETKTAPQPPEGEDQSARTINRASGS